MSQDEAILAAIGQLREDFRQHREHDTKYRREMKEELDSIKESVEVHSTYWSNVFFTGKIIAWVTGLGSILGAYLGAKAYF